MKKKKLLVMLLVTTFVLSMLTSCGGNTSTEYEETPGLAEESDSDYENYNDYDYDNQTTVPSISLSEYGFYDTEVWGSSMYQILTTTDGEVFFSDSKGDFVIVRVSGIGKGRRCWRFYPKESQGIYGRLDDNFALNADGSFSYTALDNNTLSVRCYDGVSVVLEIVDRIINEDSLIFMIRENGELGYHIPSEFVDESKVEPCQYYYQYEDYFSSADEDYYKIYLK